jgi:RNA-dependent RNA polymerase
MKDFVKMCRTAGLTSNITLVQLYGDVQIQASRSKLFSRELIHRYESTLLRIKFPWPVTFQLASLLYNGVLHTNEILDLLPSVQEVYKAHLDDIQYTGDLLRQFHDALLVKAERESPKACFQRIFKEAKPMGARESHGSLIRAVHVTITPTRMHLQGPLPTQSNNAIRKYKGYDDNFIRVDFRDEDRFPYKRNQDVDDVSVLRERVGDVLKQGISIAGRHFQFLAYSTSSLREHAVWFMSSFRSGGEMITPQKVIRDLGDFSALTEQPSKYAARIAQKFSATDPSVHIHGHEWEPVDDIEYIEERTIKNDDGCIEKKQIIHRFTDGVGTISESLGQEIFETLRNNESRLEENAPLPSAVRQFDSIVLPC